MKFLRLTAILLIVLFVFFACTTLAGGGNKITGEETPASPESSAPDTVDSITTGETEFETNLSYVFYDREKVHKPTIKETKAITPGMSIIETTLRIGKAHSYYDSIMDHWFFFWETQEEGWYFQVLIKFEEGVDPSEFSHEEVIRYGIVVDCYLGAQEKPNNTTTTTEEPSEPSGTPEPIPEPETVPVSEW